VKTEEDIQAGQSQYVSRRTLTKWGSSSKQVIAQEKAFKINSERYITVLSTFCRAFGRMRVVDRGSQWFQKYGATPYLKRKLWWQEQYFPERIICRTDSEWVPHSPDISPPDFYFIYGDFWKTMFTDNPKTIAILKRKITQYIAAMIREECRRVIHNFSRQVY